MTKPKETIRLPYDGEAEKHYLGSVLISPDAYKKTAHILQPSDFYDDYHKIIFKVIVSLHREQKPVDLVTITSAIADRGLAWEEMNSDIADLTSAVATASHAVHYAKIIHKKATYRNMIVGAQQIMKLTQKPQENEEDFENVLAEAEGIIKKATREGMRAEEKLGTVDLEEWRKIARETEDRDGEIRGISTGMKGLDDMIEGFEPGEMMILTGHTKHGKSRFAANIARNVAANGKTVLYINTEMTNLQMGRRFNSLLGQEVLSGKILLNDKTGLGYANVLQIMENAKEKGCDLVIVDHLHYFSRSMDNVTNEVSKIAKEFKDAAVALEVPLIVLCHLSQVDTKKKPTLQMIKNSSSIAQDADIVIAVWMDDRPTSDGSETEVYRLAHRSATGTHKRATLYNEGMKLSEVAPIKPSSGGYNSNLTVEGGSRDDEEPINLDDEIDLDNIPW